MNNPELSDTAADLLLAQAENKQLKAHEEKVYQALLKLSETMSEMEREVKIMIERDKQLKTDNAKLRELLGLAVEDIHESSAGTCGFCAKSIYNPMFGSKRPCELDPKIDDCWQCDCNGNCANWQWQHADKLLEIGEGK